MQNMRKIRVEKQTKRSKTHKKKEVGNEREREK